MVHRQFISRGRGCRCWGGGGGETGPCLKPLGAQKIHPVTVYLTKNFFHNAYHVAILHTSDTPCPIDKWLFYSNSKFVASRTHRRWCRDRGACHKHCGLGTRLGIPGSNPVINGVGPSGSQLDRFRYPVTILMTVKIIPCPAARPHHRQ